MADNSATPKTREERIDQAAKHKAKADRSMAVAGFKAAHALIEEIERKRCTPKADSLSQRITSHLKSISNSMPLLLKLSNGIDFLIPPTLAIVVSLTDTYKFIYKDFKYVTEIKDETLKEQFPEIPIPTTIFASDAIQTIYRIKEQEDQMMVYALRKRE